MRDRTIPKPIAAVRSIHRTWPFMSRFRTQRIAVMVHPNSAMADTRLGITAAAPANGYTSATATPVTPDAQADTTKTHPEMRCKFGLRRRRPGQICGGIAKANSKPEREWNPISHGRASKAANWTFAYVLPAMVVTNGSRISTGTSRCSKPMMIVPTRRNRK